MRSLITIAIALGLCEFTMASEVANAFTENEVVPDAVDVAPQDEIKVTYPNSVSAALGNELTPTQVQNIPVVDWQADPNQLYTLLMVDPDAPSRAEPKRRSFKHWAVVNIPGKDVAKGDCVAEYIGAGPPNGTGLHRYVFLVYKQNDGRITYDGPKTPKTSAVDRPNWSAVNFAKTYNLGSPIAGNFFQAQYDEYVPTLHAQLKGK